MSFVEMRRAAVLTFLCLPLLSLAGTLDQRLPANPTAEEIIQALQPTPASRSMRNLGVRKSDTPREPATDTHASQTPQESRPPQQNASLGAVDLAIQFEINSARISKSSRKLLESLALALRSDRLAGASFMIEGHTDASGRPAYNRKLSQDRAEEVKRTLVASGVDSASMTVAGRGSDDPIDPAHPMAPENRRVRIISSSR